MRRLVKLNRDLEFITELKLKKIYLSVISLSIYVLAMKEGGIRRGDQIKRAFPGTPTIYLMMCQPATRQGPNWKTFQEVERRTPSFKNEDLRALCVFALCSTRMLNHLSPLTHLCNEHRGI